ncbi:hypothetical protein [Nocardiopsis alba]
MVIGFDYTTFEAPTAPTAQAGAEPEAAPSAPDTTTARDNICA